MSTPLTPVWAGADQPNLPGRFIQRLMRRHHVTIRQLAQRMKITLKRVREVRDSGVTGKCMCLDWYEGITSTGIFSPKESNMTSGITPSAIDTFTGYIDLRGNRCQIDFQTQANATQDETNAAFLGALAQIAVVKSTLNVSANGTYSGFVDLDGTCCQVEFKTGVNATQIEKDAAFFAELAQISTVDYLKLGTTDHADH